MRGRWKFLGLYVAVLAVCRGGRVPPGFAGDTRAVEGVAATGELIATEVRAAIADPHVEERLQRIAEEVSAVPNFDDHMKRIVAGMQAQMLNEDFQRRVMDLGAHISKSLDFKGSDSQQGNPWASSYSMKFVGAGPAVPTRSNTIATSPKQGSTGRVGSMAPRRTGVIGTNMQEASGGGRMAEMAGVTSPLGLWDPLGYASDASEERFRFIREAELKNGRISMLAALGFIVAEQFPIFFHGKFSGPSIDTWTQIGLDGYFWPGVIFSIAIPEVFSVFNHNNPFETGEWRTHRTDTEPGNYLDFDPLGLKPTDPDEFKERQSKELNNGRLAMIGISGMIAQELVNHKTILETAKSLR